jgi:hypothetical protein
MMAEPHLDKGRLYILVKLLDDEWNRMCLFDFACLMVFNATFNNLSVLLVEETRGPRENHRPVASHWQTWSHNVVHLALI